jgi:hypothetical protein
MKLLINPFMEPSMEPFMEPFMEPLSIIKCWKWKKKYALES